MNPWQTLASCEHCRTESAVVEVFDPLMPSVHVGVPSERRCRLCGAHEVTQDDFAPAQPPGDRCPRCSTILSADSREGRAPCESCGYQPRLVRLAEPADLTDRERARAALAAWARDEGEEDPERFCLANLGMPVDAAVALLAEKQVVPTTFDVIAWLFPTTASGSGRTDGHAVPKVEAPTELPPTQSEPPAFVDPHVPARVLASVMLADGAIRKGEREFIRSWLDEEGLPQPRHEDLRVWRAPDLGAISDRRLRERLLEACVELVHLDGQRDDSEWRMIRDYARWWGVPEDRIGAWDKAYQAKYASPLHSVWSALTGLVRTR